jgi:hypothetical protein
MSEAASLQATRRIVAVSGDNRVALQQCIGACPMLASTFSFVAFLLMCIVEL